MATRKPRTNITLENDVNDVFQRLADLRKIPKATLMAEYLEAMKPHADDIIRAIELVEQNKNPAIAFGKILANSHLQMGETLNDVMRSLEGNKDDD